MTVPRAGAAGAGAGREAQRFQSQMETLLDEVVADQQQSQQASLSDCDVSALLVREPRAHARNPATAATTR